MLYEGFVYCWTNHIDDKLYVGVHKGTIDDGYVCSSKLMLEKYNENSSQFTRQILAVGQYEDMRALETAILISANAMHDSHYYNKSHSSPEFRNKGHTQKTKHAISIGKKKMMLKRPDLAERNRNVNFTTAAKSGATLSKRYAENTLVNPMQGKKHSEHSLLKMRNSKLGSKNPLFGTKASEETKLKMAEARRKYWAAKRESSIVCQ